MQLQKNFGFNLNVIGGKVKEGETTNGRIMFLGRRSTNRDGRDLQPGGDLQPDTSTQEGCDSTFVSLKLMTVEAKLGRRVYRAALST